MAVPKYVDFKCFQIKNNIRSLRLTGINTKKLMFPLTLSWRMPLSYRNQSSANEWTGFYMITASVMKELKMTEAVAQRCSVKKVFPEISQNSQENTCPKISFLIKLQASSCICTKKETLAYVFSYEFWKISESIFYCRTPPVAASQVTTS